MKLTTRCGTAAVDGLNRALLAKAVAAKVLCTDRLRADLTVVPANVPHEHLADLAALQRVGEHGLVALDWHSGNRSVLVDHKLSGMIVGQTLAAKPAVTYRALLEAIAFRYPAPSSRPSAPQEFPSPTRSSSAV